MRAVELAVGQAEGVASEEAAAAFIPDAVVVARVAGGVQEGQKSAGKADRHAVFAAHHACLRYADHLAVGARDLVGTVDGTGAVHQGRRIDQVRRAPRVDHEPRARQALHQQADTAGMVQVYVRRDDVVHRVTRQAVGLERGQKARHRIIGAGVDEGRVPVFDDQVARIETRSVEAGVDDVDAVVQRVDEGMGGGHGGECRRVRVDSRESGPASGGLGIRISPLHSPRRR